MSPYEVYIVGEHFLFSLIAFLVLVGAFNIIALVMLWAPDTPLVAKYADEPLERDAQTTPHTDARA